MVDACGLKWCGRNPPHRARQPRSPQILAVHRDATRGSGGDAPVLELAEKDRNGVKFDHPGVSSFLRSRVIEQILSKVTRKCELIWNLRISYRHKRVKLIFCCLHIANCETTIYKIMLGIRCAATAVLKYYLYSSTDTSRSFVTR